MSDALSEQQKQRFAAWLNEKWVDPRCKVCNQSQWSVADHAVSPNIATIGGGLTIGGVSYPHYIVICTNCANTLYFNKAMIDSKTTAPSKEVENSKEGGDE